MQIVIDIPEDIYKNQDDEDYIKMCAEEISTAFRNGTPIPDNATNEDIINTMFDRDMAYNIRCYVKNYMLMGEWLDAPYQKGGTNEK